MPKRSSELLNPIPRLLEPDLTQVMSNLTTTPFGLDQSILLQDNRMSFGGLSRNFQVSGKIA
jgi:hypothetical protein